MLETVSDKQLNQLVKLCRYCLFRLMNTAFLTSVWFGVCPPLQDDNPVAQQILTNKILASHLLHRLNPAALL